MQKRLLNAQTLWSESFLSEPQLDMLQVETQTLD